MKHLREAFLSLIIIIIILLGTSVNAVNSNHEIKNLSSIKNDLEFVFNKQVIDLRINLLMRLGHFPSISACIIKNDSILWYEGYGKAKLLPKQEPTPNTIYAIGSISKTVTATAIMQLWEEGLFNLDDDVNDYLDFNVRNPNFPDIPVTFRMLLSHHSSLTNDKDIDYWYLTYQYFLHKKDYPYPLIKEMITLEGKYYNKNIWENCIPGTNTSYSNLNYMLLEHLIEVLSGQSFTDYCNQNIFTPLQMFNTSFRFDEVKNKELAGTYHNIGNIFFPIPYVDIGYAFGGLKTSISDFSKYIIAYLNDGEWNGVRILEESTVDLILTVQFKNTSDYSRYCLGWQYFGWFQNSSTYGHTGHTPGGSGTIIMDTLENSAQIFFINRYIHFRSLRSLFAWFMLSGFLANKTLEF